MSPAGPSLVAAADSGGQSLSSRRFTVHGSSPTVYHAAHLSAHSGSICGCVADAEPGDTVQVPKLKLYRPTHRTIAAIAVPALAAECLPRRRSTRRAAHRAAAYAGRPGPRCLVR
eukprot:767129-Hanusia_phi.AAC.3